MITTFLYHISYFLYHLSAGADKLLATLSVLYILLPVSYILFFYSGYALCSVYPTSYIIYPIYLQVTAQGIFDLAMDCLFLIDVALNFLTAYTVRGYPM